MISAHDIVSLISFRQKERESVNPNPFDSPTMADPTDMDWANLFAQEMIHGIRRGDDEYVVLCRNAMIRSSRIIAGGA